MKRILYTTPIALSLGMISTLILGCGPGELKPMDFVQWVQNPENGLSQSRQIGEVIFTLQYKPIEYIVAMEERSENISKETLQKSSEELKGMHYFNLKYEHTGGKDVLRYNLASDGEYDQRVQYFSFHMNKDIYLVAGKDTLNCELFHFVRTHGIPPSADFVLGFQGVGSNKGLQVFIKDQVYGAGLLPFEIEEADLNSVPIMLTN